MVSELGLTPVAAPSGPVWRVGYRPDPFAWSGWEWAVDGRFNGRWDDADGNFRTVYVGETLLGCLVEVLAPFRADPEIGAELGAIEEDPEDAALHPTAVPGEVSYDWLTPRVAGSARLAGTFCAVTAVDSFNVLRPRFIGMTLSLGRHDFDAAALKDASLRKLTQRIATYLYATTGFDGVRFNSRHGDDLLLYAIFERPNDPLVSPLLSSVAARALGPDTPELTEAFELLNLTWRR